MATSTNHMRNGVFNDSYGSRHVSYYVTISKISKNYFMFHSTPTMSKVF